jgi:hypothetical protein
MKPILFALAALAVLAPAAQAAADGASLTLKGPAGQTVTLTAAEFHALPHQNATVTWAGGHTYAGVPVSALLGRIGGPTDDQLRGAGLDQVVLVTGKDGFLGVVAVAETTLALKSQPVILADSEDGAPLDAKQAPYRLIIGGELKPARSVWGVTQVELRPIK